MKRPRIKADVARTIERIRTDNGYATTNETLREVLREAGYEVKQ